MPIETWGWIAVASAAALALWLAGFSIGKEWEWFGLTAFLISAVVFVVSVVAIVGWILVK